MVSVVLPIRNEAGHIGRCLEAVLAQDYPRERMEVLVADGRSVDATREVVGRLAERDGRVRLVDNPGLIVPTGLNAAIRSSAGQVIVRIDGHTIVEPGYVREAVSALQRTGADVVGGNMTARGRGVFGRAVALATSTSMGVGGSRFHYAQVEEDAESVYMGTFRRDVFERFGYFDEGLVRNQDDEFNYRVRARGGRVRLVPSMRSVYSPRESIRALFRQYFQYGYYKIRVASLHPGMMRPRHVVPSIFVLAILALASAAIAVPPAGVLLAAVLLLHAAASLGFSLREGIGDPAAWTLVPAATLALHTAYGSGLIAGSAASLAGRQPGLARPTGRSTAR
jgi:glycosyltransferase involved in cell wall biosynthesis